MVYVTSGRVQKMDWVSWERAAREKMYYGYKYAFLADRWTYSSGAMHENKFCNVLYGDGSVGTVVDYQGWVHAMGTGGSYYPVAVGNSEGGFSSWYQAWWILDNNFDWYNATAEDWSKINY